MIKNIIKNNTDSLSFSEYHAINQANSLDNKNASENKKLIQEKENKQLFNLSLSQIGKNFSNNFIQMLNEMVYIVDKYYIEKNVSTNDSIINDVFLIFIKDERLIYSGIFFILLSFFFYFMDISS
jgi:hypothetical protein